MWLGREQLRDVVLELNAGLSGAVLQKVYQPAFSDLWLEFRLPGRSTWIWISVAKGAERIAVANERQASSPKNPFGLQQWLRKYALGKRIECLTLNDWVATLQLAGAKLDIDFQAHQFHAELSPVGGDGEASLQAPGQNVGKEFGESSASDFPLARALATQVAPTRNEEKQAEQQLKKLRRTRAKIAEEACRGPLAEQYRRDGELLSRNLHAVERGAKTVTLSEYTHDGLEQRTVQIDPKRTPRQQVDWLFHQYRRLLRGVGVASERLKLLDAQIEKTLAEALGSVAPSPGERLNSAVPRNGRASSTAPRSPYREYRASSGVAIWVGRGAKHNDALTFKAAKPHHLWLHARGVTGAHVVVPLDKKQTVDQETLLDAAHLAFHHSSFRDEPQGEVSYTFVRYVRKGQAPGAVTYTRETTFWLRVEPERLSRLLKTSSANS